MKTSYFVLYSVVLSVVVAVGVSYFYVLENGPSIVSESSLTTCRVFWGPWGISVYGPEYHLHTQFYPEIKGERRIIKGKHQVEEVLASLGVERELISECPRSMFRKQAAHIQKQGWLLFGKVLFLVSVPLTAIACCILCWVRRRQDNPG